MTLSRTGNAGMIASFAIAFAGIVVGALSAYISENGSAAQASRSAAEALIGTQDDAIDAAWAARRKFVTQVLSGEDLERLPVPVFTANADPLPKVVIIIDDMGLDHYESEQAIALPGPLTFSFLPYADHVADLAQRALKAGGETMLHLPMEPQGDADPGPHALKTGGLGSSFIKELDWNLSQFDGYRGVNNHMGSKLTTDIAAMKTVLGYLAEKGLFFIDSVTTGDTVVQSAAQASGARVFSRDVFLDADVENKTAIKGQLALVERIARKTGYAVAIGHPRKETLEILGPWLATAPARGLELVPASALIDIEANLKQKLIAEAPALRL